MLDNTEENNFEIEEKEEINREEPEFISVRAKFEKGISYVGYVFNATGETNTVAITNGKLQLMQNRTYYIPVNTDVDSDSYTIKMLSDVADKFDVRFIQKGFACVVPLQHNIAVKDDQKICVLIK